MRLSNKQLDLVTQACRDLTPEKRGVFLERLAGALQQYDRRYIRDDIVAEAATLALRGLVQSVA